MLSAAASSASSGWSLHLITSQLRTKYSLDCPNHIRLTKSSIKKRIIVRRSVRSMFGEQTFAQWRTTSPYQPYTVHYHLSLPSLHCALPPLLTSLTLCTTTSPYQAYTALPPLLTKLTLQSKRPALMWGPIYVMVMLVIGGPCIYSCSRWELL